MVFLLLVLAAVGFAGASFYAYHTPRDYPEQTIIISPQAGGQAALQQLTEVGLTPPMPLMVLPMLQAHQIGALKAGEYFSNRAQPCRDHCENCKGRGGDS